MYIKKTARKEKAEITRKKIYETAKELFTQHGFENVSVDTITEKAKVAKGTFYLYFGSKDILITALLSEHIAQLDVDYQSFIDSFPADATATDLLFAFVGKIAEAMSVAVGYDIIHRLYIEQLGSAAYSESISGYNRGVYQTLGLIIKKGIDQGEFCPDFDAETITRHCVIALRGLIYEWCIRYPDFDLATQAERHFKMLLEGFKK